MRRDGGLVSDPRRVREKLAMRERLCAEQGGRCCYCGARFGAWIGRWKPEMTAPTIEHFIPRGQGGSDDWENLVAACLRCNALRGEEPALQFFARRGWITNARDRAMERGGWLSRAIRNAPPSMGRTRAA